jgi:hypothetical protein
LFSLLNHCQKERECPHIQYATPLMLLSTPTKISLLHKQNYTINHKNKRNPLFHFWFSIRKSPGSARQGTKRWQKLKIDMEGKKIINWEKVKKKD